MEVLPLARGFHRGGRDGKRVHQVRGPFPSLPSLPLRPKKISSSLPGSPRLWRASPGSPEMTLVSADEASG